MKIPTSEIPSAAGHHQRSWRWLPLLGLAFSLLLSCSCEQSDATDSASKNPEPAAAAKHVILISCDGLRPDAIEFLGEEKAPAFHRLMKEGAFTLNARTDADFTVTLPNHTCMITGRGVKGDAGHNWTENGTPKLGQQLHRNKKTYLQGMFDVAHDHGLRTTLFASKVKFQLYSKSYSARWARPDTTGEDNGKEKIDRYVFNEKTEELIPEFLRAIAEEPYHLSMIHLRDPDTAGHAEGWEIKEGTKYLNAVQKVDGLIGQVITAVENNDAMKGNTQIIVTTDHGGRLETKTHTDAKHKLNYTIPFFVRGPGVSAGGELYEINETTRKSPADGVNPPYGAEGLPAIRNGDVGNLALSMLGLPAIEGSTLNAKQDLKLASGQ